MNSENAWSRYLCVGEETMTFAPDQEVGPYRIVSQIGRGGMATVFKAYHPALDRFVAIKVPVADFQSNPDVLARFKREVRIIAKLDHPSIIPIYDVSEFEGTPFLVMRFVEGRTLREFLNQYKKTVSLPTVTTIMRAVTSALTFAHQKQVLHRDVKPSNIMLGNDGSVYLMDFGLARIVAEADLTLSKDLVIGTPYYISPEQAKGEPLTSVPTFTRWGSSCTSYSPGACRLPANDRALWFTITSPRRHRRPAPSIQIFRPVWNRSFCARWQRIGTSVLRARRR